jgi:hypothetical protein
VLSRTDRDCHCFIWHFGLISSYGDALFLQTGFRMQRSDPGGRP